MAKKVYMGVDSLAKKVKKMYIGVDGVAKKVKKAYIGVDGIAQQFWSGGIEISTLSIGTSVYLNESGSPVEYIIVHKGTPKYTSDDLSNNISFYANRIQELYVNCDGIWLLRKNCYPQTVKQGSYNDYSSINTISSLMNDTIYPLYDSAVQSAIHTVSLPYYSMGKYNEDEVASDGFLDYDVYSRGCGKVFPLSAKEVGFYNTRTNKHDSYWFQYIENSDFEGFKLDYFEYTTVPDESDTTASNLRTADGRWWTRSGNSHSSVYMDEGLFINDQGQMAKRQSAGNVGSYKIYARPALVIDNDSIIDENMVVIGK